jgi:hypothetical protein
LTKKYFLLAQVKGNFDMFFFIDRFDKLQTIECFSDLEKLARHVIAKLGISLELGQDPIMLAQKNLGNRGQVVTLANAFKLIANAEGDQAKIFAEQFHQALLRAKR